MGCPGLGFWCLFHKAIEHLLNPKITQGGAKIHGTHSAFFEVVLVVLVTGTSHQLDFINKAVVVGPQ